MGDLMGDMIKAVINDFDLKFGVLLEHPFVLFSIALGKTVLFLKP